MRIIVYACSKNRINQYYWYANTLIAFTAWKMSKYGVIYGPYFAVFSPNTGKYGPEVTPYLDNLHAVLLLVLSWKFVSVFPSQDFS